VLFEKFIVRGGKMKPQTIPNKLHARDIRSFTARRYNALSLADRVLVLKYANEAEIMQIIDSLYYETEDLAYEVRYARLSEIYDILHSWECRIYRNTKECNLDDYILNDCRRYCEDSIEMLMKEKIDTVRSVLEEEV